MYESFGLLCPALQAYKQTLALNAGHERAEKHIKALEDQGVSTDDDEGLYRLPPLHPVDATDLHGSSNLVGMVRLGTIQDLSKVQLRRGQRDFRMKVTGLTNDELILQSRSGWIVYTGILGILGLCLAAVWLTMTVIEVVLKPDNSMHLTRYTEIALAVTAASLSAVSCFALVGRSLTLRSDGTVIEKRNAITSKTWKLEPGGLIHFELDDRTGLANRHCIASVVNQHHREIIQLGAIEVENVHAQFYLRIAAAAAVITGLPLNIAGSIRIENQALLTTLQQISQQMTPLSTGAPS